MPWRLLLRRLLLLLLLATSPLTQTLRVRMPWQLLLRRLLLLATSPLTQTPRVRMPWRLLLRRLLLPVTKLVAAAKNAAAEQADSDDKPAENVTLSPVKQNAKKVLKNMKQISDRLLRTKAGQKELKQEAKEAAPSMLWTWF